MKCFWLISILLLCYSCGNDSSATFIDENGQTVEIVSDYPEGEKVYQNNCIVCHQKGGEGVWGSFPPLANSDYLLADKARAIKIAAEGMNGEITVNGEKYNAVMSPQGLSNQEVMDVVNYILNTWGNEGGEVNLKDVERALR